MDTIKNLILKESKNLNLYNKIIQLLEKKKKLGKLEVYYDFIFKTKENITFIINLEGESYS